VKRLYIKSGAGDAQIGVGKILRKFSENTREFRGKCGANCRRMFSTYAAIAREWRHQASALKAGAQRKSSSA
jgi:hypothetical protein